MLFKFQEVIVLNPTLYIHKKIDFEKKIFQKLKESVERVGVAVMIFQIFFDLCVPINCKTRLLEAQVLKSYRAFAKKFWGKAKALLHPLPFFPSQNRLMTSVYFTARYQRIHAIVDFFKNQIKFFISNNLNIALKFYLVFDH